MKAIVTGGGSGGHIYPAIAIADKIMEKEPDSQIVYMGNKIGMEVDLVPGSGYPLKLIHGRWMDRKGNKIALAFQFLWTGMVVGAGTLQALRYMRKFKPDVVVGTGGYACVPVVMAAKLYGCPRYIHEQNAFPGVANRTLESRVTKVFLGFAEAAKRFRHPEKQVYVGNPVRKRFYALDRQAAREKLGIPQEDFVVFSFGGSQGAETINQVAWAYMKTIQNHPGKTLIFATGDQYIDEIQKRLDDEGIAPGKGIHIVPYITDMENALAAADLVIARAGALSLAEITVAGRPSILIPFPAAKDNHQYYNALSVVEQGGAYLVEEKDLDLAETVAKIQELGEDREKREEMSKAARACGPFDATERIYEEIQKGQKS